MYRTAPEKPVRIVVTLTDKEVVQAVRDYTKYVKGVDLSQYEVTAVLGSQTQHLSKKYHNGVRVTFELKE